MNALDKDAIQEVWDGDLETFAEIGRIFIDELTWRVPGLSDPANDQIEHHAHSLKGAASNVGATELSRLAAELEEMARTGQNTRFPSLISRIETEAKAVRSALENDYLGA